METAIYKGAPDCAKEIRQKVFIDEQGFENEYDDIDDTAEHIVMFDGDKKPVGTCRIFWDEAINTYVLGRLAVIKEHRGKNIGSAIVSEAEKLVRQNGGKSLALHSQYDKAAFYEKLGYTAAPGEPDNVEGCLHVWMKKSLG